MKIVCLLILCSRSSIAQKNNFCGQYEMEQKYVLQNPEVKRRRDALEKFTIEYYSNYTSLSKQSQIQSDTILFIIPVVFHVMHNYGAENISKTQILDAMRIINEDYQKRNADTSQVISLFKPIVGDVQVEFRLAQLDPVGNCTDGITRHQTLLTYGGDDSLKSIVQWPPEKYLNVWVENYIGWGNFAAYAYLPGAMPIQDGIVFDHHYLGTIGTSVPSNAHILSHEIGHYFNLFHTWGPTNVPGDTSNCNFDDGVLDTPNTIGTTTCNTAMPSCTPGVLANVQNMMEYSWCELMFTQGQVARMQACIYDTISSRNNLWNQSNLLLTGTSDSFPTTVCAPIADFSDKIIRICEGQSITFSNLSYGGNFTSMNWEFTGGNISSSTDTNPIVQYNIPGIFDVTLIVSNSADTSSLTRSALIEVSPFISATVAPTTQDFETINFPGNNWSFENVRGSHWELTNFASVSGINSLYLQNDSANNLTQDIFYTEGFNLSNTSAPSFNFKIAFANRGTSNDNLKIYMSIDCGQTWALKYSKSGNSLETVNSVASNFIPTATEWRQDAVNISSASGENNVRFKFQFSSDGGNNIYIDDITVGDLVGIEEANADAINLAIKPNPANQNALLSFELPGLSRVSYSLTDITGRSIFKNQSVELPAGSHSFIIENKYSKGLYYINLIIDNRKFVKKLIFH